MPPEHHIPLHHNPPNTEALYGSREERRPGTRVEWQWWEKGDNDIERERDTAGATAVTVE